MKKKIVIVVVGICILVGGGTAALKWHGEAPKAHMSALAIYLDISSLPPSLAVAASTTQDVGSGKKRYSNETFHFSVVYPDKLQVQEYKEDGGGFTVTFQDIEADQEFQIYATPYEEGQISEARFTLDEPSGVRRNLQDVIVDGARGIMFFSSNPIMDDTREVWFTHNGFLYELTTYKELDTWLGIIMQSWQFL